MPLCISYKFKNSKIVTKELFPIGSNFPMSKSVTFDNKLGGMDVLIHYSNQVKMEEGIPNQIAQIEILDGQLDPKVKYEKHELKLTFSNNINNIGVMDSAEIVGHYCSGKNKSMFNKGDMET